VLYYILARMVLQARARPRPAPVWR